MKKTIFILAYIILSMGLTAYANQEVVYCGDIESFIEATADLIEDNKEGEKSSYRINSVESETFATKRLIVKSYEDINFQNAKQIIKSYDGIYILQFETLKDTEIAYNYYKTQENIEYVEPDLIIKSDHLSWGYEGEGVTGYDGMGIDEFTNFLTKTVNPLQEVVVAVIDTGINYNHEMFSKRSIDTENDKNFITSTDDATDDNGHGTHVSGIIVDGTLENVKILPLKALDDEGKTSTSLIRNAVAYAHEKGVDIINMSLGGAGVSNYLESEINDAVNDNIICVVAAGNDSDDVMNYSPARIASAITVSAMTKTKTLASFSNYGTAIDFTAPGVFINSANYTSNTGYIDQNGTSMATPHVSAVVANLKTYNQAFTSDEIEEILDNYVIDLGSEGFDTSFGEGLANLKGIVPQITTDLDDTTDLTYCLGQSAVPLSVTATGSDLTYQWYEKVGGSTGTKITNATTNTYTPPTTQSKSGVATTYYLEIGNGDLLLNRTIKSKEVTVTVLPEGITTEFEYETDGIVCPTTLNGVDGENYTIDVSTLFNSYLTLEYSISEETGNGEWSLVGNTLTYVPVYSDSGSVVTAKVIAEASNGDIAFVVIEINAAKKLIPDTSWYEAENTSYEISTANALAGFRNLVNTKTEDFLEKTVLLRDNIDINPGYIFEFDEKSGIELVKNINGRILFGVGTGIKGIEANKEDASVIGTIYYGDFTKDIELLSVGEYANNVVTCGRKTYMINEWEPIGSMAGDFKGILDGDGRLDKTENRVIKGIFINTNSTVQGLLGYLEGDLLEDKIVIKNIGIDNSYISGSMAGAFIGKAGTNVLMLNLYNGATISGNITVGGICGQIDSEDTNIINSYNMGVVNAVTTGAGGLVGINNGGIYNSYNVGKVIGGSLIEDIAGQNNKIVENCYYLGVEIGEGDNMTLLDMQENEDVPGSLAYILNTWVESNIILYQDLYSWCSHGNTYPKYFIDYTIPQVEVTVEDGTIYKKQNTAIIKIKDIDGTGFDTGDYVFKYYWGKSAPRNWDLITDTITISVSEQNKGILEAQNSVTISGKTGEGKIYVYNASQISDLWSNSIEIGNIFNADMYLESSPPSGGGGGSGGGGNSTPQKKTYKITTKSNEWGTVEPAGELEINKGETKEIKITPNDGYELDKLLIDNNEVPLVSIYKFENVLESHTLEAFFKVREDIDIIASKEDTWIDFTDVEPDAWYYDAVKYVVENNLFTGVTENEFEPKDVMTRAMIIQVLYNKENMPEIKSYASFEDVDKDEWYYLPICWACENNIAGGISETSFAPQDMVSREQIVTILFNYLTFKKIELNVDDNIDVLKYKDFDEVSPYARDAVTWALKTGLIKGRDETSIKPCEGATRGEVAAIFMNLDKLIVQ